jgi:hypothetical protein
MSRREQDVKVSSVKVDAPQVYSTSTLQETSEFIRVLDAHPAGGILFLLILVAVGYGWKTKKNR